MLKIGLSCVMCVTSNGLVHLLTCLHLVDASLILAFSWRAALTTRAKFMSGQEQADSAPMRPYTLSGAWKGRYVLVGGVWQGNLTILHS